MAKTHILNHSQSSNIPQQDKFILPSHALDQAAALLRIGKGLLKSYIISPDFTESVANDEALANDLHLLLDAAENSINYVIHNTKDDTLNEILINTPTIPTSETYSDLYKY